MQEQPSQPHFNRQKVALLVLLISIISGCAATSQSSKSENNQNNHADSLNHVSSNIHDADTFTIPVVRVGRYKLIAQNQLALTMRQLPITIDVTVSTDAAQQSAYVRLETAIEAAIARSGYSLCSSPAVDQLITRELPAEHYRLGPMTLSNVLQVLVGPDWVVQFDDAHGTVCFIPSTTASHEV